MTDKSLTDAEGEVRELTVADMKRMRPAAEVLPAELLAVLPKRRPGERGPGRKPAKEAVSLRLDPEVVAHFKAGGEGWQSRLNAALLDIVRKAG